MATRISRFSQIILNGNDFNFTPIRLVCNLSKTRFSTTTAFPTRTALIVGSSGFLGSAIVSHLYEHQIVTKIIGVDIVSPPQHKYLNRFISLGGVDLSNDATLMDLTNEVKKGIQNEDVEGEDCKFDTIICSAGGFLPTSDYTQSGDFFNGIEEMIHKNLFPVLMATQIAATKLKPGGEYDHDHIAYLAVNVLIYSFIISNLIMKNIISLKTKQVYLLR